MKISEPILDNRIPGIVQITVNQARFDYGHSIRSCGRIQHPAIRIVDKSVHRKEEEEQ